MASLASPSAALSPSQLESIADMALSTVQASSIAWSRLLAESAHLVCSGLLSGVLPAEVEPTGRTTNR